MKKILITNAWPANNGDAILVFSLYHSLQNKKCDLKIACFRYNLIKGIYKNYPIVKDILDRRYIFKFSFFNSLLIALLFLLNRHYRTSDVIIGCPGGYLSSYYNFRTKLYIYRIAKLFNKKTAIYAVSLGPFSEKDLKYFQSYLKYIDILYVRDQRSYDTINELDITGTQIIKSVDAAFLSKPTISKIQTQNKIAISVRSWEKNGRNDSAYYDLITRLVDMILNAGYEIEFISTCQGIKGYVDDSEIGKEIIALFDENKRKKIKLDTNYYDLYQLRKKLKEYKFILGTRLHMCLISLLNGIPAFNISYEFKGKEAYSYLNISELSIDYNENISESTLKFKNFLENIESYRKICIKNVQKCHLHAKADFDKMADILEI